MGKLIVLEGIDGSGKSTQLAMLCRALEGRGRDFRRLAFPRYAEPSSLMLRRYLNGEFGDDPAAVNAYAASTFFAVDRCVSFIEDWSGYYRDGGLLLSDRYTTSNAIHQAAKLAPEKRGEFLDWLYDYEFAKLELPKPDIVLYMDVPLETAMRQMRRRERETDTRADIHERDIDYLALCRDCGDFAAERLGWTRICCAPRGSMLSAEEIHAMILGEAEKIL